jgi:uncharacterized LabA/DUF88 family protein/cold shock CspA family protein|uniref:Cold shock protein n=1 Tax=Chlorobium chlorochromatii (strain CaD3) TaxID=340177 RepID=Q3AP42_CHLCH
MVNNRDLSLTRIGVFYDGNYFLHISNYYNYFHERKARISISGLHHFVRNYIAQQEGSDEQLCQIVDAHYFRGRLNAYEAAQEGNALFYDRLFDDILSSEGVTTHYLPVKTSQTGVRYEKGIDVWLALEAFEQAFYKRFDVLVLIASDGDYVPLIRKLNTLGTRVMVLSWDFEYTSDNGKQMTTRTSQDLLEEVTYPVAMHEIIDNRIKKNEPLINNLFVPPSKKRIFEKPLDREYDESEQQTGTILALKDGYGFIKFPPNNLFFHYSNLNGVDFNDLKVDDAVQFVIGKNDRGDEVAKDIVLVAEESAIS